MFPEKPPDAKLAITVYLYNETEDSMLITMRA